MKIGNCNANAKRNDRAIMANIGIFGSRGKPLTTTRTIIITSATERIVL